MRRNAHKRGQWLVTDDYTGRTHYSSEVKTDYWGNIVKKPLVRNLQEIASPFNDPQPVPFYRGPTYEAVTPTSISTQLYIGTTTVRTPISYAAEVLGYDAGIGQAVIGTTFMVR